MNLEWKEASRIVKHQILQIWLDCLAIYENNWQAWDQTAFRPDFYTASSERGSFIMTLCLPWWKMFVPRDHLQLYMYGYLKHFLWDNQRVLIKQLWPCSWKYWETVSFLLRGSLRLLCMLKLRPFLKEYLEASLPPKHCTNTFWLQ